MCIAGGGAAKHLLLHFGSRERHINLVSFDRTPFGFSILHSRFYIFKPIPQTVYFQVKIIPKYIDSTETTAKFDARRLKMSLNHIHHVAIVGVSEHVPLPSILSFPVPF